MTVLEEVKAVEKKNVLVGIRIDNHSRELLSWALVKIAEPGDRVVAVHVCRGSDAASKHKPLLDGYLEVYEGLCNLKQVDLTGQILTGSSIRKALVREAKNLAAVAVVVGISSQQALGSWASTFRYCAKRLPPTTEVLAIHNGKVVFRRCSNNQLPGLKGDPRRPSLCLIGNPSLKESQSEFGDSEASEIEKPYYEVVQSSKDGSRDGSTGDSKEDNFSLDHECKKGSSRLSSLFIKDFLEQREQIQSSKDGSRDGSGDSKEDNFGLDRECKKGSSRLSSLFIEDDCKKGSSRLSSLFIEDYLEQSEQRPGWPLLQKASLVTPKALEARKLSVVQWVMSLPNRSPPQTPQTMADYISNKTENPFLGSEISQSSLSALGEQPRKSELLPRTNLSGCRWFSHEVLKTSTSQFSSENLIGKGGCNRVYKGLLPDGKPVAVKILKSSKEAWKDFALEVNIISFLKHKHITPMLGVCIEDNNLISVYDFLSKGSLEENLHGNNKDKSVLSWEVRFNVAVGVAEALNYLHNECSRPVLHRDVKSSNILLSDEFEPQLSDFGLAIWGPTTSSFLTHCDVVGTFGYLAPEYFMYGKVSDKIDVYSFGVVLLELLSGRKPIGSKTPKGQESLVMWAKPILESGDQSGDLRGILDPNLDGNFDEVQMQRMVLAATLCITRAARLRPKMSQILKLLRGEYDVDKWVYTQIDDRDDSENQDNTDDEVYPESSAESHLSLALLDVDGDSMSFSSVEQSNSRSLEEYLKGRWSRSSSLD